MQRGGTSAASSTTAPPQTLRANAVHHQNHSFTIRKIRKAMRKVRRQYRAVTAVTDGFVPIFWRTVDDAADSLIDGVVGLGDYMPGWAGGPEPAIVESFEDRPLTQALPIMMVVQIIGMLYISFVCVYMPVAGIGMTSTTSIKFHTLVSMSLASYYQSIVTDPGRIPEAECWKTGKGLIVYERKKTNGQLRYCKKEGRFKPDRAHFCTPMGRNVLRMDHYCPWTSNCVGYNNHKYFLLFLMYSVMASNMVTIDLLQMLTHHTLPAGATFFLVEGECLSALLSGVLTPFFLFHCWLSSNNMTTIEFCEKKGTNGASYESPYNIGVYRNLCSILGENPLLWPFPCAGPRGDGLSFAMRPAAIAAESSHPLELLDVGVVTTQPGSGADGQPAATSSNERGANPNEGEGDEDDDEDVAVDGLLLEEHVKTRGIAGSSFDVEDASQVDVAEEEEGWSAWSGFQNACFQVHDTVLDAAVRFNKCVNHEGKTALRFSAS